MDVFGMRQKKTDDKQLYCKAAAVAKNASRAIGLENINKFFNVDMNS